MSIVTVPLVLILLIEKVPTEELNAIVPTDVPFTVTASVPEPSPKND
jgi:hypothetical protein